ncbi:MAG: hypothetical protein ACTSR7_19810 [Promethearchaeota archaeon]
MTEIAKLLKIIGGSLGIIGGIIMCMAVLRIVGEILFLASAIDFYGQTGVEVEILPLFVYLKFIPTLLCIVFGIVGGILIFRGSKKGSILALIGGILGLVGPFIIIRSYVFDVDFSFDISLSASFTLIDPLLITVGGLLGIIGAHFIKKT